MPRVNFDKSAVRSTDIFSTNAKHNASFYDSKKTLTMPRLDFGVPKIGSYTPRDHHSKQKSPSPERSCINEQQAMVAKIT